MSIITRFAPSPTGLLHLGHAHAALFAWRRAREAGGQFLLRLEDIDPAAAARNSPPRSWRTWPGSASTGTARSASSRSICRSTARRSTGWHALGLLYPCFCTRADILRAVGHRAARAGRQPALSRHLPRPAPAERAARIARGEPHALRLDMAAALRRRRGRYAHEEGEGRLPLPTRRRSATRCWPARTCRRATLRVTHDDAVQGVTLVTRGEDLRPRPTCTGCCRR